MNIWAVIPAFNEEKNIAKLLQALKEKRISSLVVDDGSGDATYAIARTCADRVIRHQRNTGKGTALKEGIAYLLAHTPAEYALIMDADGQHQVSDIDAFVRCAQQGGRFIVGTRMDNPAGMPWVRVATNRVMSWFISGVMRQRVPDTQCGFRLIHRDVLAGFEITTNRFEVESEILIKAARNGCLIQSVPVRSVYFAEAESRINPFFDTVRFFRFICSSACCCSQPAAHSKRTL